MLSVGWLSEIAAGHFETEIVPLAMTDGYGDRFEGKGLLTWTKNEGVRVEAWTDGAALLLASLGRAPCAPGELIPDEFYLRLEGQTRSGEDVVIARITREDYNVHTGHSTVVWRIPQKSVFSSVSIVSRPSSAPRHSRTELLMSPVLLDWPRASDTTYENPHFATSSSARD